LIVDGQVVVEIKAVKTLNEAFISQALSYLKGTGLRRALIINFGASKLVSGVKRISL
jgi:GxxExxY protein